MNYTTEETVEITADITPRLLKVQVIALDKAYDGTTAATVTLQDDRVPGDDITVSYRTAAFADERVGKGKVVRVGGTRSAALTPATIRSMIRPLAPPTSLTA